MPIHFNLSGLHLALPEKVIVTVAFNSTHYGLAPVGESATCFGTAAGCPYDSLNIATDGNGGSVGTTVDANSIFVNYASAGTACINTIVLNSLVLDPGCWGGYHPQIEIRANQNSTPRNKKPAAP